MLTTSSFCFSNTARATCKQSHLSETKQNKREIDRRKRHTRFRARYRQKIRSRRHNRTHSAESPPVPLRVSAGTTQYITSVFQIKKTPINRSKRELPNYLGRSSFIKRSLKIQWIGTSGGRTNCSEIRRDFYQSKRPEVSRRGNGLLANSINCRTIGSVSRQVVPNMSWQSCKC